MLSIGGSNRVNFSDEIETGKRDNIFGVCFGHFIGGYVGQSYYQGTGFIWPTGLVVSYSWFNNWSKMDFCDELFDERDWFELKLIHIDG